MNITFNDFSLQGGIGCPNDYIMIRDGKDASARLVGKYCGASTPPGYTSSSDHAFINFVTDGSITNKGFSLRFAQTNFGKDIDSYQSLFVSDELETKVHRLCYILHNMLLLH